MRLAILETIRILTHSALLQEALADHVAAAAAEADAAGNQEMAKVFRAHGREQRVRVLELQGKLAALRDTYAAAYAPER